MEFEERMQEIRTLMEQAIAQAEAAVAMPVTSYATETEQRHAMKSAHGTLGRAVDMVDELPMPELPDHHWHLNYLGEEEEDRSGHFFYPKWEYPTLKSAQDKFRLERFERDEMSQSGRRPRRKKVTS